ncbi:MAG: polyketide synthase [candidate division FCPU426 bacterium]
MSERLQAEVAENGIARLRMLDAETKNRFSQAFVRDMLDALEKLAGSRKAKVLILSGLPDVFCGGAEKEDLLALCEGRVHVKDLAISERLVGMPFPVIAAMEGHAVGGGLVLAACSDLVVAARESRYGAVFMSLGFTPGMGCTRLLAELMGPNVAAEMMYTAKSFKGRELEGRGTQINYILPKAEVMAQAENLALQISEKRLQSVLLLKQSLGAKKQALLAEARAGEDRMHRLCFADPETRKRIEETYPA